MCHDHPGFAEGNYRLKLSSLAHLDAEVCQTSGIRIRQSAIDEWCGVRSRHPYESAPQIILQWIRGGALYCAVNVNRALNDGGGWLGAISLAPPCGPWVGPCPWL